MYVRLSHILDSETPTYKHASGFSTTPKLSMTRGDIANSSYFTMMNHVGTHLEAPHHFLNNLRTIDTFEISAFVFDKPALITIKKGDSELITRNELESVEEEIAGRDILLVRTGFGDLRLTERQRYEYFGPGFSAEAAEYLQRFSELRALGVDFVSLNSPRFEADGFSAHKILLSKHIQDGFFIIEDMELNQDLKSPKRVIAAPLLAKGLDAGPCTVIADI